MSYQDELGKNATFADPVGISQICAFFNRPLTSLAGTFGFIDAINLIGFNDLDDPNSAPYNLGKWRRYDHHRPSAEKIFNTDVSQVLNLYGNGQTISITVQNNAFGRAYTFNYTAYLGTNPSINDSNTGVLATGSGTVNAGTELGDDGIGVINFAITSNFTFPHSGTHITADSNTVYYLMIQMSCVDSGNNSVKNGDYYYPVSVTFKNQAPPVPAPNLVILGGYEIHAYNNGSGYGGVSWTQPYSNVGGPAGGADGYVLCQCLANDGQTPETGKYTVGEESNDCVPNGSTETFVGAGTACTYWTAGKTVYVWGKKDGGAWMLLGSTVVELSPPRE